MKTTNYLWIAVAALALVSACEKGSGYAGREIRFGVGTAGTATKAAYGESEVGGLQAIDWAVGDEVLLGCAQTPVTSATGKFTAKYRVAEITQASSDADVVSKGKLELSSLNGLMWPETDPVGGYTFYGVYPATVSMTAEGALEATFASPDLASLSTTTKYTDNTGKRLSSSEGATYTYKEYIPDGFLLTAVQNVAASGSGVTLTFRPAFTAFEFNLLADDAFTVTGAELIAQDSDYLLGSFTMTAGNLSSVALDEASKVAANRKVSVTLNDAMDPTTGVSFTLFTLPIANTKALTLRLITSQGNVSLPFTYAQASGEHKAGDPYVFEAGRKYRVNLLRVRGKWQYAIQLAPGVNDWNYEGVTTDFAAQIQAEKFTVKHHQEAQVQSSDKYGNPVIDPDTGEAWSHINWSNSDSWYDVNKYETVGENTRYYQVRTLNMKGRTNAETGAVIDPGWDYFEVTFRPIAPLGGYWWLEKQALGASDTPEMFKVEVWDNNEDAGDTRLEGQIMAQTITLHISLADGVDRTRDHALGFKTTFSPTRDIDDGSSADSEMQDTHKDGTFSLWKFVFPAQ